MITDKKLGVKVFESDQERIWTRIKQGLEKEIKEAKESISVSEVFLKTANQKLKEALKEGKKP